mmetsp:Transcript_54628/g.160655  ORF Transcript_54628/g.160655 Transcript_54628/m.160655 type:complete len:201 (-) Transcript_54628:498-1100(-)
MESCHRGGLCLRLLGDPQSGDLLLQGGGLAPSLAEDRVASPPVCVARGSHERQSFQHAAQPRALHPRGQQVLQVVLPRRHLVVVLLVVVVVVLLVLPPLDAPHHQLLVALGRARATLDDDDVGHARAGDAAAGEVELLGIHVNLEEMPLVLHVLDLEDQHLGGGLALGQPLLLLLGLALFRRELPRLVTLLVLLPPLLDL